MIPSQSKIKPLEEYSASRFSREELPEDVIKELHRKYKDKVTVNSPSFMTDDNWEITPQGWVGYIPLPEGYGFILNPKVPLRNLFGMWEYAYRLKAFHFLDDLYTSQSLKEFYEQLATILARRILDRGRKGYYRKYLSKNERLPYVRGQLNIQKLAQMPWNADLYCHYQEHTSDIDENQILAWTMFVIARSGFCGDKSARTIRNAYRNLQGLVSLAPFKGKDCVGRLYNRLNQDYQPLHALSRFFLENSGPEHAIGEHSMLPFLVNMASLYELFVAEWLKFHLPDRYRIKSQERVDITETGQLYFKIDLVLYDSHTERAVCVLDTKYKAPDTTATEDISQIASYAHSIYCENAILIYPSTLKYPLDGQVGKIKVRSLTFALDNDLEIAGQLFMSDLLKYC